MRSMRWLVAVVPMVSGVLAACGGGGDAADAPAGPPRVVEITMRDNDFSAASVLIDKGETITFRFTNAGSVEHEGYIGDEAAQEAHAAGHDHSSDAVTVQPGQTGELTHTFTEAGTFILGCHIPGHYESGMKSRLVVE